MNAYNPTPEQIAFSERPTSVFVVACPGAGKTRTVVARLARIAPTLPPRKGVAILSFTNTAVEEFIAGAHALGLISNLRHPGFVGTFDAFLRQFFIIAGGIEGVAARPRVIDSWRTLGMEVRLAGANNYRGPGAVTLDDFDPENNRIDPARIAFPGLRQHVAANRAAYEQRANWLRGALRRNGYISAADARVEVQSALQNPRRAASLGAALASRFQEIVVDEAQDCNPLDLEIVAWLRDSGIAVTVVSDPDQAIYSFRHGNPNDLLQYRERYPVEDRLTLTGNFRSTPAICALAATLRGRAEPDRSCGETAEIELPTHIVFYGGAPSSAISTLFSRMLAEAEILASNAIVLSHKRKVARRACGVDVAEDGGDSTVARLGCGLIAWPSKGLRRGKWRRGSCGRACRSGWRVAANP